MRTCPECKARYTAGEELCALDGSSLVDDEDAALSLSDTLQSGGAARPAHTPAPVASQGSPLGARGTAADAVALAAPRDDADPILGSILEGRYEVTRKVGAGGMGAVYEARHALIDKRVAIKVLLDKYAQKPDVVARLQQEARLASTIGHEHIVDITDFGTTEDGRTFVVMEFLEGESLASLLQREGPLPAARAVRIVRQVANALGAAHDKGIVHRDVKPENVFITRRGDADFVKVVDFGISKAMRPALEEADGDEAGRSPRLTQTGMVLGTPLYMSPEQARGEEELDHRIDVYALGTILYETLTGEVPFRGNNYLSIISQVLSQEPRPPTQVRPDLAIPPGLEGIVLRAMAKDRAQRYASMAALDADLARVEGGAHVQPPAAPRALRRRLVGIAAWTAGIAAIVGAVALVIPRVIGSSERLASPAPGPPLEEPPPPAAPQPVVVEPPAERTLTLIRVRVQSEPPGAEVWWEAVRKGTTPTMMELPRRDDQIELTLRMPGHDDAKAKFYPTRDQELTVTLTPKASPRPPRRSRPARRSAEPAAAPDRGPTVGGEIKPNPFVHPDRK